MAADPWQLDRIEAQAPTPKASADARKLADGGAFSAIRPHPTVRRGWMATTRGSSGTYSTLVAIHTYQPAQLSFGCDCPSHQYPCKHALGLAYYLASRPELRPEPEPPPAITSELDALVRACFATPEQNLPRLVLADYVEERGDTDRATILRIQCEFTPPKKKGEKAKIGRGMARPLKAAVKRVFAGLGNFPVKSYGLEFQRGFLSLRANPWVFHQAGEDSDTLARLFREGWVETVLVTGFTGYEPPDTFASYRYAGVLDLTPCWLTPESLVALATELRPGHPDSRVKRILVAPRHRAALQQLLDEQPGRKPAAVQSDQAYSNLSPEKVRVLVSSGTLNGVEMLNLSGDLGADGLRQLAGCAALARVRHLTLQGVDVPADNWRDIWNVSASQLRLLDLSQVPLGDEGVAAFCEGRFIPRDQLALRQVGLTGTGIAALAACPRLNSLRQLDVSDNTLGGASVATLLASPHLGQLERLRVSDLSAAYNDTLDALFAAQHRTALQFDSESVSFHLRRPLRSAARLTVSGSAYARASVAWPTESVCPEPLAEFEVTGIDLTPVALRRLADWFAGHTVASVAFSRCRLRNDDLPELLKFIELLKPSKLDLRDNQIGVNGCKTLAASAVLAGIRTLYLSGNPLRLNGVLALAESPHRGKLKHLHARYPECTAAERKKIAAQFKGVRVTV